MKAVEAEFDHRFHNDPRVHKHQMPFRMSTELCSTSRLHTKPDLVDIDANYEQAATDIQTAISLYPTTAIAGHNFHLTSNAISKTLGHPDILFQDGSRLCWL